jgi:copper chaperone CopZ
MQLNAQIKAAEIQASGLTCSMCSKAIYKALGKVSFVNTVKVNIETSTFLLEFKQDQKVQIEALRDAVYDAGFAIEKLAILMNFTDKTAVKDAVFENAGYQFKWQLKTNKPLKSEQKVFIVNKDIQPVKGVYLLNY